MGASGTDPTRGTSSSKWAELTCARRAARVVDFEKNEKHERTQKNWRNKMLAECFDGPLPESPADTLEALEGVDRVTRSPGSPRFTHVETNYVCQLRR